MDDLDRSLTIGRSSRRSWAILDDLHNQLTLFSSRFQPFDRIFVWDFLDVVHPSLLQVHHCLELHLVILNWKLTTRNLVSIPREYERGSEQVACPANRTVPRIFKLSVSKISLMVFVISSRKYFFYQFFSWFKSRLTEVKNITLNSNVDLEFFAEPELPIGQSNQSQRHLCQMITADKLKATNDEICYRLLILIIAVWPTSWDNEWSPFQLLNK